MPARRVVRERIDPRLTAALFSNHRSPIDAVLVSLALAERRRRGTRRSSGDRKRQGAIWK